MRSKDHKQRRDLLLIFEVCQLSNIALYQICHLVGGRGGNTLLENSSLKKIILARQIWHKNFGTANGF